MSTKPIDKLLFIQGARCFFCDKELTKQTASIEHLLASSKGGANNYENCVVCCKQLNGLFGNMTLKEKIQVILNQKGEFTCPNAK